MKKKKYKKVPYLLKSKVVILSLVLVLFSTFIAAFVFYPQKNMVLADDLNCSSTSVGFKAITDMSSDDSYFGEDGGLYGNGENNLPSSHSDKAQEAAELIVPRDFNGQPGSNGKIGLVSIGFSNTRQEFSKFIMLANSDSDKSSSVVAVNGAQGSQTAQRWADNSDSQRPWIALDNEVSSSGLSSAQVQVVWMKFTNFLNQGAGPLPSTGWVNTLRDDIATVTKRLKTKYPNLKVIYMSSRIYAGYTTRQLNPEPYAYESAFSHRKVILDQINGGGATSTNYNNAPVLLWGPYLWADGLGADGVVGGVGGREDGLEYECSDYETDGTHPADNAEEKVANMLLSFFKEDDLTKTWFLEGEGDPSPDPDPDPNPEPEPGISIIENGSFEIDSNNDGMPDIWKASRSTSSDGRVESTKANGNYAFQFVPSTDGKFKGILQQINQTGSIGDNWTLKLWSETGSDDPSGNIRVRISFVVGSTRKEASVTLPKNSVGSYHTANITAPSDYTSIHVYLETSLTNSNVLFDDVSLTPAQ